MKKKRAVLAGEFDPITDFDYSIIQRCSLVFDEAVLLLVNNDRHAFFLPGERLAFLNELSTYFPNVSVDRCAGMAGSYCQEHEIPQSLKEEKDLHIVPCPENIPAFLADEKIREVLCIVNKARGMLEEVQKTEELTGDAPCSIRLCLMNGNEYR